MACGLPTKPSGRPTSRSFTSPASGTLPETAWPILSIAKLAICSYGCRPACVSGRPLRSRYSCSKFWTPKRGGKELIAVPWLLTSSPDPPPDTLTALTALPEAPAETETSITMSCLSSISAPMIDRPAGLLVHVTTVTPVHSQAAPLSGSISCAFPPEAVAVTPGGSRSTTVILDPSVGAEPTFRTLSKYSAAPPGGRFVGTLSAVTRSDGLPAAHPGETCAPSATSSAKASDSDKHLGLMALSEYSNACPSSCYVSRAPCGASCPSF